MKQILKIAVALLFAATSVTHAQLVTFPASLRPGMPHNDDYIVRVRIIGQGILDHPIRGIEITDFRNVLIDSITVVNPDHYTVFGGGATGITIRNLKSFRCKGWSDGIDLMCCRNVLLYA